MSALDWVAVGWAVGVLAVVAAVLVWRFVVVGVDRLPKNMDPAEVWRLEHESLPPDTDFQHPTFRPGEDFCRACHRNKQARECLAELARYGVRRPYTPPYSREQITKLHHDLRIVENRPWNRWRRDLRDWLGVLDDD